MGLVLKWINTILKEIPTKLPVILYAKTPENRLQLLAQTGVSGLSLDERHDLSNARKELPCLSLFEIYLLIYLKPLLIM